jgi:hypothetical protein
MTDPLEQLFASARNERLTKGEMSALWNRVSASGVAATATGGGLLGASGAGAKALAALLIGGSLASAAGVHLWRQAHPAPQDAATAIAPPPRVGTPNPPVDFVGSGSSAAVLAGANRPPASAAPSVLPSTPDPALAPHARTPTSPGIRGTARGTAAPRLYETPDVARGFADAPAPESATAAAAGPRAAPSPVAPLGAPPSPVAAQAAVTQTAPVQADVAAAPAPAPSEAALLLSARRALDRDPAAALALTDEHARRFPAGTLVPEREILAIEALARLGRSSEARRRLDALRARFPNAANIARLESLIGTEGK